MHKIRYYWEAIRTSFWFLPTVMTVLAASAALLAVWLDEVLQSRGLGELGWAYSGSAEGARQLLATVAGSMVTVAGVVFSVTVVALSLTSSQFGPRLLRNFMRDRGNQVVLGTFIATFVYCLLVLRTVRGQNGGEFVPNLAVSLAILFALASLGVLIYFIHHASASMQAPQVIANVSAELHASIDTLFPENLGGGSEEHEVSQDNGDLPDNFEREAQPVTATSDGYVQLIDDVRLMQLATEKDLLLCVVHRPGDFVVNGDHLAIVWSNHQVEDLDEEVRKTFALGHQQTPTQDIECAVNQLVEVAVRALSPGINDPFTAMTCVDQLGAALCRLATRSIPSPYRRDDNGRVRVIAYPLTFAEVANIAFRQIRQYGRTSTAVLVRLLEVIAMVMAHTRREEDRAALLRQALLIKQSAEALPQEADRVDVTDRYDALLKSAATRREQREGVRFTRSQAGSSVEVRPEHQVRS